MKKQKGISLIALIITIIVIIILAAIVVASALNTPGQANWAKFTSDYSEIQNAVTAAYADVYGRYALGELSISSGEIPTKAEIYNQIATGTYTAAPEGDSYIINFTDNEFLPVSKPSLPGNWAISSIGVLIYPEGYEYNGKVYISPTEEK